MKNNPEQLFGRIDIYLFDQLLKGRFTDCKRLLDVGVGGGKNLPYFLQNGYEVFGVDTDPAAIDYVRQLAAHLAPGLPGENFVVAAAEALPFEDNYFDWVICSAILHFAESDAHFEAMLLSAWRVLKPGGYFFARLASDIGMEKRVVAVGKGVYELPDGSSRYLVNEEKLLHYTRLLGGEFIEPIKTTLVQNMRSMTTWCLQKR